MKKAHAPLGPLGAALAGFLFCVPFVVLNFIVALRIEPFYTVLRPASDTGPLDSFFLVFTLLLLPLAVFVTVRPMLRRDANGERKFYLMNAVFAAMILAVAALIWGGLSEEIIMCDYFFIPNCD